jgi:hypothetical protein
MAENLTSALALSLRNKLNGASDKFIRLEVPAGWPVTAALVQLQEDLAEELRIGILKPFLTAIDESLFEVTSSEPNTITRWRNQAALRSPAIPTIVLGPARGPKESGLLGISQVVKSSDVMSVWSTLLQQACSISISSKALLPLLQSVIGLVGDGIVDAMDADAWFQGVLADPATFDSAARETLWKLGLVPDTRVLDKGKTAHRIRKNRDLIEDVLSVGGNAQAEARLVRLQELIDAGIPDALKVREFQTTRDASVLQGLELDELSELLDATVPRDPTISSVDFFGLLDRHLELSSPLSSILQQLATQWNMTSHLVQNLEIPLSSGQRLVVVVQPLEDRHEEHDPIRHLYARDIQVLSVNFRADYSEPLTPSVGEDPVFVTPMDLTRNAGTRLGPQRTTDVTALAHEYLECRYALQPFANWFSDPKTTVAALLVFPDIYAHVEAFIEAWTNLLFAARSPDGIVGDALHNMALMLESVVSRDSDNNFIACRLGPLHPYALEPSLKIADYVRKHLNSHALVDDDIDVQTECRVGEQANWGLEHAVPAFVNLSISRSDLYLAANSPDIVFLDHNGQSSIHTMDSAGGIEDTVKSFIGLHRHASHGISMLVVNPPPGRGFARSLRWISETYVKSRFYIVTEGEYSCDPSDYPDSAVYLGHFADLDDVLEQFRQNVHTTFVFGLGLSTFSVSALSRGPVGGVGISPTIGLVTRQVFDTSNDDSLEPRIFFQPRQENRVVLAFATRNDENTSMFEVAPMLARQHDAVASRFAERCEWLVLGAPFPLGSVPPRVLTGGATFIGRESQGQYSLFVYTSSMYSARRLVEQAIKDAPVAVRTEALEREIENLAVALPGGVMRMARSQTSNTITEQIGMITAIQAAGVSRGNSDESGIADD